MIREAASEQDEIGWIEFYKGHLSKEWATIQLKHYCNMYKNPPSITHWSKTIISRIYNITFEMWSNRNKEVHNEYEDNMNKIESEKLQQEITESYKKGASNVMVHHRYLLEETLDEIYKNTVKDKKYWLQTIQASCICYEKYASQHNNTTRTINLANATVPD